MGLTLSLPTPLDLATNNAWGTTLNTAINSINGADVFKVKTATDTRTSTTLTDDTHLAAMTLGVGTWVIEVAILVSGPTGGDFKMAYAFTGTTTLAVRGAVGPSLPLTSALTNTTGVRQAGASDTGGTITTASPYGTDATNWSWILEKAVLVITVSGTFKIQTAQNAASGTTTIQAGSYCWARQVL